MSKSIDPILLISLIGALLLISAHFSAKYLSSISYIPRSSLLSIASGISVSYVFVHLLPELAVRSTKVRCEFYFINNNFAFSLIYLVGLFGLVLLYSLESLVKQSRKIGRRRLARNISTTDTSAITTTDATTTIADKLKGYLVGLHGGDVSSQRLFWIHLLFYGCYNFIVGTLLVSRQSIYGIGELFLFTFAIWTHLIIVDFSLRDHHKLRYVLYGRWMLGLLLLAGWFVGFFVELPEYIIALTVSFIGGATILSVLKEELPEETESKLVPFILGIIIYSSLLLFIQI